MSKILTLISLIAVFSTSALANSQYYYGASPYYNVSPSVQYGNSTNAEDFDGGYKNTTPSYYAPQATGGNNGVYYNDTQYYSRQDQDDFYYPNYYY